MVDSKYVVVYMSSSDLYAHKFEYYEEALNFVEEREEKAYIIKIENFCIDGDPPTITLESHT